MTSGQQSRHYWDDRHRAQDELRSGGNIGASRAKNAYFYASRSALIAEHVLPLVEEHNELLGDLRALDAGCGKGHFSRTLADMAFRVDGIDTSARAIAWCQEHAVGGDTYWLSAIQDWAPPYLYDVAISIDVLFHIMQDDEWAASVRQLAAAVRIGGRVLLVDHGTGEDRTWSDLQKTRSPQRYQELLTECGVDIEESVPMFPDSPLVLHVATKVAS